jgi:tetratricopeptide (TPR) repeat protein
VAAAVHPAMQATRQRWLYGPFWDLMLGCGGLYLAVFAILWASGPRILGVVSEGLIPLALLATSVPHYGATLLRVYEHRDDRRKYAIFAVWASIAVWAAFVWGVYDVRFGSWFVTLFLTWSPWHYSGQNYGIGLMLLGRGGVRVPPQAKRLIWASFFLSWLLVVFSTHGALPGGSYAPTPTSLNDSVYAFIPLGIPLPLLGPLLVVTALGYAASLVGAFALLRRQASWADLAPLAGAVVLQAVWFSIPVLARATSLFQGAIPLSAQYQGYTLLWIALGHSLQYLWVTTYFATAAKTDARRGLYWVKAFLAGGALFAVPVYLFSPGAFGVYSFESGLGVLIAAAVNLHHFILDGAIWKLRDGRIARILLRRAEPGAAPLDAGSRSWVRPLAWSLIGAAGVAYGVFYAVGTWEIEYGFRRAMEPLDPERMRTAARRLARVGHDHPALHLNLGVLAARDGDLDGAQREAERSLALGPNVEAWMLLGQIHQQTRRWEQARSAYDSALALDPQHVPALGQSALVSMQLGDFDRAEQALERAIALAPERQDLKRRLDQVRRRKLGALAPPLPGAASGEAPVRLAAPPPSTS